MTERRSEVIEMHLFDENARREEALCGAYTSANYRRSVSGYLEDRVHGLSVGNVCQERKMLAVSLAGEIIEGVVQDLEAEGRIDVVEDYRELATETGQNPPGG